MVIQNPIDKALWEHRATSDAILERGRAAATASKEKTLQQMMRDRGIKEEMIYDQVLLEQGKTNCLSLCSIQNMSIPVPMEFKSLFLSLINSHDRLHHFETLCHYFVHEGYIMYVILFNWLSMQVWILTRIERGNYFSFRSVKLQRLST